MKRTYLGTPLAIAESSGWKARLMVERETGRLVYGVIDTPDGRTLETPHPVTYTETATDLQERVNALLHDYMRSL